MSRHSGRTPPMPGFSRGVPIIGQPRQEPPSGSYFYQVPVLIRREGQPLDADSLEFAFPLPLEGALFKGLGASIAAHLQEQEAKRQAEMLCDCLCSGLGGPTCLGPKCRALAEPVPAPKVVVLQPIFLGFVPQEQIDAAQARAEATPEGTVVQ